MKYEQIMIVCNVASNIRINYCEATQSSAMGL